MAVLLSLLQPVACPTRPWRSLAVGLGLRRALTAIGGTPSRAPVGGAVTPGRARPPGLPPSNGEGDRRPAPSSGFAVAPGRGRPPALPFPRSTGDGETPNEGACCRARNLRVPVFREDQAKLPDRHPRPLDLCQQPAPGCLPRARRRESAAERSLDFRFLIFCSSSALLGTPFQPCSNFGCATLAFTAGGFK